ncbi:MAG: sulfatase modifying factor 1 [Mariniblastus sp.]
MKLKNSALQSLAVLATFVVAGNVQTSIHAQETQATASASSATTVTDSTTTQRLGIVTAKPESGPSVKIEGGYMVPYEATIPGTEVKYSMVPIPGGKFTMGSPEDEEDRLDDEGPQFEVTVEPFWMGKHEVTWAEYKEYMKLYESLQELQRSKIRLVSPEREIDGVTAPSELYDVEFTYGEGEGPKEPAATMANFSARQYTKWLSLISGPFHRLPTEAEWEYACRAGTTTAFSFGDDPDDLEDHAWFEDNSDEFRMDVGDKKPNPWGLYDMHGNVAEWVLDQYDEDGYTHVEAGASLTVAQAYREPTTVYPRVVRGGSYYSIPEECRSASRLGSDKEWKNEDPNIPKSPWWLTDLPATGVGFRLIRPLTEPATMEEKNKFWKALVDSVMDDVESRIRDQGKGAYGIVDPQLIEDTKSIDN